MRTTKDSEPAGPPGQAEGAAPVKRSGTTLRPPRPDDDPALPAVSEGTPKKSVAEWREDFAVAYEANRNPLRAIFTAAGVPPADAEDMVHDAVLRGANYLWYPQDPQEMKNLLGTIAYRMVGKKWRGKRRHSTEALDEETLGGLGDGSSDPEQAIAHSEELQAAGKAFEDLRAEHPDRAEQFQRAYVDGVPATEIATETGETQDAVWKRLSRTKARLRDGVLDYLGKPRGT